MDYMYTLNIQESTYIIYHTFIYLDLHSMFLFGLDQKTWRKLEVKKSQPKRHDTQTRKKQRKSDSKLCVSEFVWSWTKKTSKQPRMKNTHIYIIGIPGPRNKTHLKLALQVYIYMYTYFSCVGIKYPYIISIYTHTPKKRTSQNF